jgi:hypothetical protein
MDLAGMANAANLETAGRLQRLHLEPDSALCSEAEGAGFEERGFYVEECLGHGGEVNARSYTDAKANRNNHLAAVREARTMKI